MAKSGPPYNIPVIVKTDTSTYWKIVGQGAMEAGKANPDANVTFLGPDSEQNIEGQIRLVEDQITKKASVLVVAPSNSDQLKPTFDKAKAAGIPVILIDTDADWPDKVSFIGTDNEKGGKLAGDYYAKNLQKGDKVAIIRGALGDTTHNARQKGAEDAMKAAGLNIVAIQPADSDRAKGQSVMENILTANPDLKAVFCTNDEMALGASNAAKQAGKKVQIIGFDANPDALTAIKAGDLTGSVAQFPKNIGKLGVENALKVAKGETIEKRIDTGTELVTKDNLDKFMAPSTGGAQPTNTAAAAPQPTNTLVVSGSAGPNTLTILSLWGASELDAFQKVLDGFTAQTGTKTQFIQARDFVPALRTMIAAGNPPMVAIVPRPGVMGDLAREGSLKPLTSLGLTTADISAGYSQAWQDLGTVDGKLYGIAVKANSKSTVWYHPDSFKAMNVQVPTTWDQMLAISDKYVAAGKTPWAVGGGDSWTLTDWFENVYVRTAGPDKYNQLFATGKLPFTDASVVKAAQQMTSIVANDKYVAGGKEGVLGTKFVDGIGRVFGKNADAQMYFEGGFVGGIALKDVNTSLKVGTDIDFFPFPTIDPQFDSPLIGGGDLLVAFADNPQVRAYAKYMIGKQAGEIWAKTGAIVSPNKQVDPAVYPNDLTRKEAAQVAAATVFRFDGSDQLPGNLADDWGAALQAMVTTPGDISKILADFEVKAAQQFKR
jgi:ABC-type sugar transport system substrate-binding protein